MNLPISPYLEQAREWPKEGKHILACFDQQSIVVYQAYRPAIGDFAIKNGYLGGPDFSYSRMSWIKPNFLWMMYRSGWGTKEGQQITLGLRIRRAFFDRLLRQAIGSAYDPEQYPTNQAWQEALANSDVRRQWDPDHDPFGAQQPRRAIQLGLRGRALAALGKSELLEIIDLSAFVAEQRQKVATGNLVGLKTPHEHIYLPALSI